MSDDWKKLLPFPAHWASYFIFKILIVTIACAVALKFFGAFG
jgi:hypothetical protein